MGEELKQIVDAAIEMRQLQRKYFRTRDKDILILRVRQPKKNSIGCLKVTLIQNCSNGEKGCHNKRNTLLSRLQTFNGGLEI